MLVKPDAPASTSLISIAKVVSPAHGQQVLHADACGFLTNIKFAGFVRLDKVHEAVNLG